jgi:predicted transcriptional regulator
VSKKSDMRTRHFAVGLYKKHKAGATVRQLAEQYGKTEKQVSSLLKIGERFADEVSP